MSEDVLVADGQKGLSEVERVVDYVCRSCGDVQRHSAQRVVVAAVSADRIVFDGRRRSQLIARWASAEWRRTRCSRAQARQSNWRR